MVDRRTIFVGRTLSLLAGGGSLTTAVNVIADRYLEVLRQDVPQISAANIAQVIGYMVQAEERFGKPKTAADFGRRAVVATRAFGPPTLALRLEQLPFSQLIGIAELHERGLREEADIEKFIMLRKDGLV